MSDDLQRIAQLNGALKRRLLQHMETPCIYPTAIEGFNLVRREDAGMPENCFEKPLVGLVIQGTKHSLMGGREYVYTENQSIVAGVDMPISSRVINPTHEKPFLFLYLYLDRQLLSSLVLEMRRSPFRMRRRTRAFRLPIPMRIFWKCSFVFLTFMKSPNKYRFAPP